MQESPETFEDQYRALRRDTGAVWLDRDAIVARGPDAVSFLQGQLSQDLAAVGAGSSAFSFVLEPQGKVDALVRVTRTGEDELVLDTDGGAGEALFARLDRFNIRVKCTMEHLGWRCLALRGPRAPHVAPPPSAVLAVPADWPGLPGVDLLGEAPEVPDGVPVCGLEAYEAVRIEAGIPRMGAELTDQTMPHETGVVDRAVSFTKGCFTGQELVCRVESRGGHAPRRLRGIVLDGDTVPPTGANVDVDGRTVGALTSAARSPALGVVALAYVGRAVEPPAPAVVRWDGGEATGRVETLPLVP